MANLKNTTISDTGFFKLPSGDTAARPASPAARQLRFNTDTGQLEQFRPGVGDWIAPNNTGVIATGGDSVYDVDVEGTTYRVHVFTSTGTSTFTVLQGGETEYLIVAGGAGGTNRHGGAGGAGGLLSGTITVSNQIYVFDIGAGGNGPGQTTLPTTGAGQPGENSSAFGLTAIGGGPERQSGGSGGGGDQNNSGGSGTSSQGNDGGSGSSINFSGEAQYAGGGGGGAGSAGGDAVTGNPATGGDGGIGLLTLITGLPVFFAGGGGGGAATSSVRGGFGGPGGGGNGGRVNGVNEAQDGTPSSGGGGGAGAFAGSTNYASGSGGSGIVIIRYPLRQNNPETAAGQDVGNGLVLDLDFAKPTVYSGSGSVVSDSRLNGIEGSISNTPVFINQRTHRSAFDLDENSADIIFPNQYMSTQNATNVSYSFWIYNNWSAKTGYQTVFGIQQSSFDRVATLVLNTGANGIISFDLRDAGTLNRSVVQTDLRSFSNQWLNIAYTFDAGNHALYLNGILETTDTDSLTSFPSWVQGGGGGFALGDNASSSRQHGGVFAVTKIFTKTLSAQEIEQDFNATRWRFGV